MAGQGGPLRPFPPPLPVDPWAALLASLPAPGGPPLPQLPTIGPAPRPQAQAQPPRIGPAPEPTALQAWTDPQQLTQALQDLTEGLWRYGTHPAESLGKAAQGGAQAAQGLWEFPTRAGDIAQGLGQVGAGGFVQGMGDYLGERFGSPTQTVQTALTDPVGFMLDLPVDPASAGTLSAAAMIAKPGRQVMKAGSEAGRLGVGARRVYPGMPGFYSKTVEAAGLLPEQLDVAGVLGAMRGLGATDKNMQFLKLDELLAGRTGKIGRDEIVQHLEQNLPRLDVKPRGGANMISAPLREQLKVTFPNRDIAALTPEELTTAQEQYTRLAQVWQRNGDRNMADTFFKKAEEITEILEGTKHISSRAPLFAPRGNYARYSKLGEADTLSQAPNYTENPLVVKPPVEPGAIKVKPEERWEDRVRIAQSRLRGHGISMRFDMDANGRIVNPDAPVLIFADTNNPNRTLSWGDVIERIDDETADYALDAMRGRSEYAQKFVNEPAREPYRGGHMREDDVMAWTRTQDRPLAGSKELGRSVEEYQSDLHHDAFMRYQRAVEEATSGLRKGTPEYEAAKATVPKDIGYDVGGQYVGKKNEAWRAYDDAVQARDALVEKYGMSWTDAQRYYHDAQGQRGIRGKFGKTHADGRPMSSQDEAFSILNEYSQADDAVRAAREVFEKLEQNPTVWDAPFKGDWNKVLLKQQLWDVAHNPDLSWIGHTTGETQNWRYNLADHFNRLTYNPETQELVAYKGSKTKTQVVPEAELPQWVGKEVAEKLKASGQQLPLAYAPGSPTVVPNPYYPEQEWIIYRPNGDQAAILPKQAYPTLESAQKYAQRYASDPNNTIRPPGLWELRGKDLEVGGQGKKQLYDVRFTKDANEVLKPFGAEPMRKLPVDIGNGNTVEEWVAKLSPEVKQAIRERGLDLFAIAPILMALDSLQGGYQQ